jgi:RND family efflux transporter MFP subunit
VLLCACALGSDVGTAQPSEPLSIAGITEPVSEATLSAMVPGTIRKIHFREGASVKAGDVILELDKQQEELEVARRKLVWESRAEVDSASDRVATVKMDLDATRTLFEQSQSVSKDEMDKKELEYKLAVAELERLRVAEDREKIEYEMALDQLARRDLKAPFDGTITKIHREIGESCEPDSPLADLVDASRFYFVASVEAGVALRLKVGDPVDFADGTASGTGVPGRISFVSPVLDPASGLQSIKAVFDNPDARVRPGAAGNMISRGTAHGP